MRCARLALAALLVAPALVVLSPGAALACSCAEANTAELVGYVDTVGVGQLTAMELAPDNGALITYTATLQTVLKGEPDNPLVFRSEYGDGCGLEGMAVGREYVFFVRGRQADLCGGTAPASLTLVTDVEAVTGPGEAAPASTPELTEPEPEQGLEAARETGTLTATPWGAVAAGAVALLVVGWLTRHRWSGPRSGGRSPDR